ncbi:hypothetical protein EDC61_10766 [Sulfuritortus calidifontis]|uniref:Uncharacterized protein n=1 Tax=Sulfuritortus calidifontis TaxID=1914471 RepID=A0A4R3JVA2_9PROT|nr:hypothetical protein [Sulfuritortus calidifontis]TCS71928.1 hypothetical protein EDC61_10766 [Sulfuritortus calidifontis]
MNRARRHPLAWALLGLGLLVAVVSAYHGGRAALADAFTLKARWQIGQWRDGEDLPAEIEKWRNARDDLQQALALTPDNPQLYDDLGFLYALRAYRALAVPDLARPLLQQALTYYRQASLRRPMSPHTWANIALARHYLGESGPELWQAFDLAMAYGQNEPAVQTGLAEIGLARWGTLSPERKAALRAAHARALPTLQKQLVAIARRHGVADYP